MNNQAPKDKKRPFWLRLFTDIEDQSESGCFGVLLWFIAAAMGLGLSFGVFVATGHELPESSQGGIALLNPVLRRFLLANIVLTCVNRVALALATWPLVMWYQRVEDKALFRFRMGYGLYLGSFTSTITSLFVANTLKAQGHLRTAENVELFGSLIGFFATGLSGMVMAAIWLGQCKQALRKGDHQPKAKRVVLRLGSILFVLPILIWFAVIGLFQVFGVSNKVLFPYR